MAGHDYKEAVQQLRNSFDSGVTRNLEFRKKQLKGLQRLYEENDKAFMEALSKDLRKPACETLLTELNMLKDDITYALSNINDWVKPEKVPISLVTLFDQTTIFHDPYGVVLIMGAWNYPLQLPMLPVSGAIAAGNCVLIKPSEISPATAALLEKLIPEYVDPECVRVICGGIPETTALLKEKFDYIFYTGSTAVGRIVREAANKHLTPTTLELGGKSPVYLDDTVNMDMAVRRIMWGKCLNLGQTCVAPDYLLCTKSVQDTFIAKAKEIMKEWYGDDPQKSADLCRVVNNRHFKRLVEYLKDGKAAIGGVYDESDLWIEPTILINVSTDSKVMTDEIFGPILPIMNVESAYDAIKFINARLEPLSLYLFSNSASLQKLFQHETRSGSICMNDTVIHVGIPTLPFGGVGNSGMGAYHGKASYDSFTHRKSCLKRNYNKIADYIGAHRYPPYTEERTKFLASMLKERSFPSFKPLGYLLIFGLGALSLYAAQQIAIATGDDN